MLANDIVGLCQSNLLQRELVFANIELLTSFVPYFGQVLHRIGGNLDRL